jgi:mRNA interferase MazF
MESSELRAGDIVVVPFPYSDKLAEKRRPALVISNQHLTEFHGLVWVVMVTSAKNPARRGDIALPLEGSGLTHPSIIRTSKIATLEISRILRVAGQVSSDTMRHVLDSVLGNFNSSTDTPS